MREPAGQNDDVGALEIGVLVPEVVGLLAEARRVAAWNASSSQLLPGKTMMPNFMSVDLDAITFDDRIREQLVGDFGGERAAPAAASVGREIELEVLALPDVLDAARSRATAARRQSSGPADRTPTAST